MSRPTQPQVSFADWELMQQGIELEPVLLSISDFLDDHAEMVEAVRRDLERGLKKPQTGRSGLTPFVPTENSLQPLADLIPPNRTSKLKQFAAALHSGERNPPK